jgi:hypothetical protein
MSDFSFSEAWFDKSIAVKFTDGSTVDGRLTGADGVGLECELTGYFDRADEGLERIARSADQPLYVFVPWSQIKVLYRL